MLDPHQPLGRLIRLPFKLISPSSVVRVLTGPNRGLKWVVGAGNQSCWLGTYESDHAGAIAARVKPGMTVFDVGAHAGYYTLMLSRLVGPQGRVLAFEANPANAARLRRHLHLNDTKNIEVIEAAVTDRAGETFFRTNDDLGEYGYMGKISESGTPVRTVRLDDFPTPDLIKMDIEGAETLALSGAERLLSERKSTIFLALHDGAFEQAPAILKQHGYQIEPVGERELWATPS
jgi:FkbM family methyltransferase